ncbi:MAG TPA: hypothetical protein VJ203_06775 [Bacteroidales bacterium]|nr:hypothetical protein [Bacteroidales bacterium]
MPIRYRQPAGLLLTALLSVFVLYAFYGNLFGKINTVFFATGGDGMQSYVNMEYHIRHDSTYLRCNSMNYPYGEHVFFTNNQPLISNSIKFISQNLVDISDYTLGILNFTMLFCLVIAPLFLYLIFTGLGVGTLLSILASVGIAYLSPQLDRFGGHFNLSYVCAIPLMILLLMRFFKKPSAWLSVLIFLTVMTGALTSFYFYGFFAVLILFFYGAYLAGNEKLFPNKYAWALHLFIQLVLPFLILQAFYISDHITDRPAYPWGFLVYRAWPQSIFLPFGRPYGQFLHSWLNTGYIDWEGYAFVGMLAFAGTIVFLVRFVKKTIVKKFDLLLQVTPNRQLNILFWAAMASLLYSFGLPFILGLEGLVDLIGPVRQMRGVARFSWIFFYVMNIITVYWLWNWWASRGRKPWKTFALAAALLMLCTDAWYNVRNRGVWLNNSMPALTDKNLELPENQWINHIDKSRYQAIIPLPYFHIGSENIWIDGGCEIVTQCFIAIKNSGIPCTGAMLSRTSISQTVNNMALMLEPSCSSVDMGKFPSQKPFLMMVARCELLSDHERLLIKHATAVDSSGSFGIYELPFNTFRNIADSIAAAAGKEYLNLSLYDHDGMRSTDSTLNFRYVDSGIVGKAKNRNTLFNANLPHADTGVVYIVSFLMDQVRTDLYPRTRATFIETDSTGNIIREESFQVFEQFRMIDGDRVLVEYRFRLSDPANRISLTLQNKTLRNKPLRVDNVLIRPENTNLYFRTKEGIWKNNRYYCR